MRFRVPYLWVQTFFYFDPLSPTSGVQSIDTDNDAGLPHPRGQQQ